MLRLMKFTNENHHMSVGAYISVVITGDVITLANGSTEILEPFAGNCTPVIITIDRNYKNSET